MELDCPAPDCTFTTPAMTPELAMKMLELHRDTNHRTGGGRRADKPKRPLLELTGDSVDETGWALFKHEWIRYKTLAELTNNLSAHLQDCLSSEINRILFSTHGQDLLTQSETTMLANVKQLVVRARNPLVSTVELLRLRQSHEQPVQTFLAEVRSTARQCKFKVKCNCDNDVDYTDQMVLHQLLVGLSDEEVQEDLLALEDLTLTKAEKFVMDREAAKRSQGSINQGLAARISSSYKKSKTVPPTHNSSKTETCRNCGGASHSGGYEEWKTSCPAYGTICACGKRNHFTKVCRRKGIPAEESIKGISSHHLFHLDQQLPSLSSINPDNALSVILAVNIPSLSRLRPKLAHLQSRFKKINITGIADTGASALCGGPAILNQLGIPYAALTRSRTTLRAADGRALNVLGTIPVTVSVNTGRGDGTTTNQLLYVVQGINALFISRQCLSDLGSISKSFPNPPQKPWSVNPCEYVDGLSTPQLAPCGCLLRTITPCPPEPPCEAIEENIEKLQTFLRDYYASSTFNTCSHQPLPLIHGPALEFAIDSTIKPTARHTPATVPLHWMDKVKSSIDDDVSLGVLEWVDVNTPVTWCHRMVVVRKHNGAPRRTVDMQALNAASIRQTHHTQSPFQQATTIPKDTWKSITDAWNGYHSVAIREEDRHMTTFITPWGRLRYKTAPQGYLASGDAFTHRFDKVTMGFQNVKRVVDDSLVFADNIPDAFAKTAQYLSLIGKNGILQNPDKFVFCRQTIDWAGIRIGPDSVMPLSSHTEAILGFPSPTNVTDIRSFFALVNQVSHYYATQPRLLPFRELLKKDTTWYWDDHLEELFQETKRVISSEVERGVTSFDPARRTALLTDWCKSGIGFLLMQQYCDCLTGNPTCCKVGWKVCMVGSRFTSHAESNYAPTEGEGLAIADALHRTRYYTLGCADLVICTDHKPLLGIFNDRSLEQIDNPRVSRLKEKTLAWRFSMVYIPGRQHGAPDCLSRYGFEQDVKHRNDGDQPTPIHVDHLSLGSTAHTQRDAWDISLNDIDGFLAAVSVDDTPITHHSISQATSSDDILSTAINHLESGTEPNADSSDELRKLWRLSHDLNVSDGCLLYKDRAVIPTSLRHRVLKILHSAHQGATGMTLRAEQSVFWPGMSQDVRNIRASCTTCNTNAPSLPKLPPQEQTIPDYPFQHICADYMELRGTTYGVIVDRFSGWFHVYKGTGGSHTFVDVLTDLCRNFGVPETLTSDGGPHFTSHATLDFLRQYGIHHRRTSVGNPHANSRAEIAVKTAKRLLRDNTSISGGLNTLRVSQALFTHRNTPDRDTGLSPAYMLLGRPLKEFLPNRIPLKNSADLSDTWKKVANWRELALSRRSAADQEKWSHQTRKPCPLAPGDSVMVQNTEVGTKHNKWDKRGVVVRSLPFDQYEIMVDGSRRLTLRNRKHIRQFTPINGSHTQLRKSYVQHADTCLSPESDTRANLIPGPTTVPLEPGPISEELTTPDHHSAATSHSSPQAYPPPPTPVHTPVPEATGSDTVCQTPAATPPPPLRRSTRCNKGVTSKYTDYCR